MTEYSYYSLDELDVIFEQADDELATRLTIAGSKLVKIYKISIPPSELVQEAIVRLYKSKDRRNLPREVSIFRAMYNIMRSIASDEAKRSAEEIYKNSVSIDEEDSNINLTEVVLNETSSDSSELWERIITLFPNDDEVLGFIQATREGYTPAEITKHVCGENNTLYSTIRRRIMRGTSQLRQEIH